MGRSEYSYELVGVVVANPERVIQWWFDPNRPGEIEKKAGTFASASVTKSTANGLRHIEAS